MSAGGFICVPRVAAAANLNLEVSTELQLLQWCLKLIYLIHCPQSARRFLCKINDFQVLLSH